MDDENSIILAELADNQKWSLTDAERRIIEAFERDSAWPKIKRSPDQPEELVVEELIKLSDSWGDQQVIRPAFLSWLFTKSEARKRFHKESFCIPNCRISPKHNSVWDSIFGWDLSDCELPFELIFDGCVFPDQVNFDWAKVRKLSLNQCWIYEFNGQGMVIQGDVQFRNCRINQTINLTDSQIKGSVVLRGCAGLGLESDGVTIGKNLEIRRCQLTFSGGGHIYLRKANVQGDMRLSDVAGVGMMLMEATKINGNMKLIEIEFEDASVNGLGASRLEVAGELSWLNCKINDKTKLWIPDGRSNRFGGDNSLKVGRGNLNLDGFKYDNAVNISAIHFEQWLVNHYVWRRQPYEEYARWWRGSDPSKAIDVLIKAEEERRRWLGSSRLWSVFLKITTGYGYRPLRSLAWIIGLVVIGAIIFHLSYANGALTTTGKETPPTTFNTLIYSLDLFLPIVNFRQAEYWIPSGAGLNGLIAQYYMWLHIALGWVLTTLAVAGFTGFLKGKDG